MVLNVQSFEFGGSVGRSVGRRSVFGYSFRIVQGKTRRLQRKITEWAKDCFCADTLEKLDEFLESGAVYELGGGNGKVFQKNATQLQKAPYYAQLALVKGRAPKMMDRLVVKKMKAKNPKVITILRALLCPLEKTYPMRGGLQHNNYTRFMNAVDTAFGKRLALLNDNISNDGKVNLAPLAPWCFAKEQTVPDKDDKKPPVSNFVEVKDPEDATHIRHRYGNFNVKITSLKGAPKLDNTWILRNGHMDQGYLSRLFCI